MNVRYLGNDTNVNRIVQASEAAVTAPAQAAAEMTASTARTTDTIIQGQAQLQQLEMQRLQSEVARASKPSGLAALANEGIKTVFREKQNRDNIKAQEAKLAAEQAKERQRLSKEALEKQREQEFTQANDEVLSLETEYIKNNWAKGTTNYKDDVAKIVAKHPNLTPKHIDKLLTTANNIVSTRESKSATRAFEETKALNNQVTDTLKEKLGVRLKPALAQLAKLSVFEQSTDFLQQKVQPLIDEFFQGEGSTLSLIDKLKIEQFAYAQIATPLGEKSEAYATYLEGDRARKVWIEGMSIAYQKLESGEYTEADVRDKMLRLENETGRDFSKYSVSPQEQRDDALKQAEAIERYAQIKQSARDRAIGELGITNDEAVRQITAGLLSLRGYDELLKAHPLVTKLPEYQAALGKVKEYKEFKAALANQKIADADTAIKFQRLNLTSTDAFIDLAKQLSLKRNKQETLTPLEQLAVATYQNIAQTDPNLGATIQQLVNNPEQGLTKQQLQELQAGLATKRQAIRQIQEQVVAANQAARDKIESDYSSVIDYWGTYRSDDFLRQYAKQSLPNIQNLINNFTQQIRDAEQNAIQSSPYGARSNFNDVGGGLVGSRQRNGSFKIAPKTSLQVQKHPSGDFITPISAGVRAPHSFNMGSPGGALGGGYGAYRNRKGRGWVKEHAGIDFPLRRGQKAVTPVSGKVLSVRNLSGYGGTIDVLGDNGFVYRYTHQRSYVAAGQRVEAGDAISTSNGSGVGSDHLHFEVRPYAAYKKSQFGMGGTIDPVTHLRELTKNAGTSVGSRKKDLRGQPTGISNRKPYYKVDSKSIFTPGGGALSGNIFQQVGQAPKPAKAVFNHQRPMTSTTGLVSFRAGTPEYNYQSNFGSSYLSERQDVRKAFVDAAKELKVPTEWIVDIAAQESGAFRMARQVHPGSPNQNYGLFGFGSDSGVKNWRNLNEVQQIKAYVKYMKDNGWMKHIAKVGGNTTIAQLWAMTRMGTNWRKQALNGRVDYNFSGTGKTFKDELRLLGNHFGREYDVPGGSRSGRSRRNSAIRENPHSNLQQTLTASGTFIPTREG